MIRAIYGTIVSKTEGSVDLEVGPVRLRLLCSKRTAAKAERTGLGFEAYVEMRINDGEMVGYCFFEEEELESFDRLMRIRGVGPAMALRLLSDFSPRDIEKALDDGEVALFVAVKGLGKKTAERIMKEYKV
jgi:Holliday junction DNA helicase RuvA